MNTNAPNIFISHESSRPWRRLLFVNLRCPFSRTNFTFLNFFWRSLQTQHMQEWRRIATIFVELIRKAGQHLGIPSSRENVRTFPYSIPILNFTSIIVRLVKATFISSKISICFEINGLKLFYYIKFQVWMKITLWSS